MKCPCCSNDLSKQLHSPEIDACDSCQGMWFEAGEFRAAKDSSDRDLNWMDFEIWKHEDQFKTTLKQLPCPNCNKALVAINYSDTGVEVDYCPDCKGTWLDKGEFEALIDALTHELLTKSFSEYVKSSLEEAKELITGPESFLSEWKDLSTVLRMMQYRLLIGKPQLLDTVVAIQQVNPIV